MTNEYSSPSVLKIEDQVSDRRIELKIVHKNFRLLRIYFFQYVNLSIQFMKPAKLSKGGARYRTVWLRDLKEF